MARLTMKLGDLGNSPWSQAFSPRRPSQEVAVWPYSDPVATAEMTGRSTAEIFQEESDVAYRPTLTTDALYHTGTDAEVQLNGGTIPFFYTLWVYVQ